MTAGGDGQVKGKTGAERMRDLRARRRAERLAAEAQARDVARRQAFEQLPLMPVAAASEEERPRPGRPAGSVARATAEWRRLMLERYRSPLIVMAEAYSRPVEELARELRCTRLEAFQVQQRAAAELAPFLHSKMPIAIQGEGLPQVGITLAVSAEAAAQMGVALPPIPIAQSEQEQRVIEGETA